MILERYFVMAQVHPRFCPRCGAGLLAEQQACAHCGLDLTPLSPSSVSSTASGHASIADIATTPLPGVAITPTPVMPKRNIGRIMIVCILLLLLIILGSIAYIATSHSLLGNTQAEITTITLNTPVTYAGMAITVTNVQQSAHFANDSSANAAEVTRLNMQVANKTSVPTNLLYQNMAHLVLPTAQTLSPILVSGHIGVPAGTTQIVVLDFPLAKAVPINQLTLRLGATDEQQMNIPLVVHPNLNSYSPKTKAINQQLQYFGLNWTIVSATTQLSIAGQQAPRGMHYAVIAFSVDNTLSQIAIPGSPYTYIHMQQANTTFNAVYTTLPVSFATGETGQTGTVTFLIPQQTNTITLVLGTQQQNGFDKAVTNFSLD